MLFTKFSSASGGSSMTRQQILAQRDEAKKASQIVAAPAAVLGDARDVEAIYNSFVARHSDPAALDYFYDSDFNVTNLTIALENYARAGQVHYDSNGWEAVHAQLLKGDANGYPFYEPRVRKRGQAPAVRIVLGVVPGPATRQAEPVDEVTALRRMSDADLRKVATSGQARTQEEALNRARQRDQEQAKADRETARNMPFSDLERLVRSGYRPQRAR